MPWRGRVWQRQSRQAGNGFIGADVEVRVWVNIRLATLARAFVFLLACIVLVDRFALGVWVWIGRHMFLVQFLPASSHRNHALEGCVLLESLRLATQRVTKSNRDREWFVYARDIETY